MTAPRLPNLFKVPELKEKILFTLLCLVVYRIGAHIATPGVNVQALADFLRNQGQGTLFSLYDLFAGGGFGRPAEPPAREQIVQAEQRALTLVPQEVGEGLDVHAGRRDVRPDAVDDQAQEREEDLFLQLRNFEQVGQPRCGHGRLSSRWCRPPARSSSGPRPTPSRPSR